MRARAMIILALLAACETKSALYCEKNPGVCTSTDVDAGPTPPVCSVDDDCTSPTPHCLDMTACVQCRTSSDCANPLPTCGADHTCGICKVDTDCDSLICLEGGTCAATTDVAFIGGTDTANTACTKPAPCASIRTAFALPSFPRYVRAVADVTETSTIVLDGTQVVDVYGAGHKMVLATTGAGFDISGTVVIGIRDLELAGGTSSTDCIAQAGAEVSLQNLSIHSCTTNLISDVSGKLTIRESRLFSARVGISITGVGIVDLHHSTVFDIAENGLLVNNASAPGKIQTVEATVFARCGSAITSANKGFAALDVRAGLEMTNSIVVQSGSNFSAVGGLKLTPTNSAVVESSTFADNAGLTPNTAISCASSATIHDSIVLGDPAAGSTACTATFSLVDVVPTGGTGDLTGDPKFVSTTEPTDPTFYRIGAGSKAIGSADPTSTLATDIDGKPRPLGHAAVGASEYVP